jgi:chromosome segregation ATPase
MTDIVTALRLRIEDDEASLYDHELHRHALKAIQELRGKLQTVTEACTLMRRETDAEIERLRAAETELTILRSKLTGTLTTTHDCTDRTDCALRKVVWHLRAIL